MNIVIRGQNAKQCASQIRQKLESELALEATISAVATPSKLENDKALADTLIAAAALIVALPSGILAYQSLIQRGKKSELAEQLLTILKAAQKQGATSITLRFNDGSEKSIEDLTTSELLDLPNVYANPEER